MISGVHVTQLRVIGDERGAILHMLKHTDAIFTGFGEVYFSKVAPGQRKSWRKHQVATSQLAVPVGRVLLALYDDRVNSPSSGDVWEITLGESDYRLLTIPPGIWFAFQNVGQDEALIANCSSVPHNPANIDRQNLDSPSIPYFWQS